MIIPILNGGLGNQLFEISNAYAFAKRYGFHFGINYSLSFLGGYGGGQGNTAVKYKNNLYINIPSTDINLSEIYREKSFGYNEIPRKDNILLYGYFQSKKYFNDYANEVKNLFVFPEEVKNKVNLFLKQFNKPTVSIHIRRGDYLHPGHPNKITIGAQYYAEAVKFFKGYEAIICTDDIASVKKEMNFKNAIYSPFNNEIEDLCLLSQCDNSIICNSSFAWWGSFLGKDKKIVIAPKEWPTSGGHQDFQDIYNEGWILL